MAPDTFQPASRHSDTRNKTLVLCFDGTLDRYNNAISNIARLVSFFEKNDPEKQLVYYQAGVGTSIGPAYLGRGVQYVQDVMDSAFATSLDRHVRSVQLTHCSVARRAELASSPSGHGRL